MQQEITDCDGELVQRSIACDERAFETLFERYAGALHRHAVALLHDETAAHDVVQETFLRVWTHAEQWSGIGSFKAWLYRIATNLALNMLRTEYRRHEYPLELPDEYDEDSFNLIPSWMVEASSLGPEVVIEQAEEYARVTAQYKNLLNRLPDDKREVFRLVREMEMSLRDAADALNIPEGTVKSRLHYARKRLAREWREKDDVF